MMKTDWICRTSARLGESYYEARHASGLTVLVAPKDLSTYHAILGVRYGAADRLVGTRLPLGVAHFLEHKMFEKETGNFDDDFASLGAEVNAYTTYDRTAYLFSCTDRFPEALTLLLQMTGTLHVTSASVARERDIIAEEIRMNADDPFERCYAELLRALFRKHPVREEICGSERSIRRITPRILQNAHEIFYRPDRMVLSVSGRTTPDDVMAIVDRVLGSRSAPDVPLPRLLSVREPSRPAAAHVTRRMSVSKPLFVIGVKMPTAPTTPAELLRCDLTMSVLSEMLFSHAGDFYNDLFERGVISPGMSYGTALGAGYGCFSISGECDDPAAVWDAFAAYIRQLRETGLPQDDFHRIRRILYADFVSGFDSVEDIASALFDYAMDSLHAEYPVGVYDYLNAVEALSPSDVETLFEETFREAQCALSTVLPYASASAEKGHSL